MSPGTVGGSQLCPWRGKLGSWHHIPPGLGWGMGCPHIHVPAGCPGDGWGSAPPNPWNPLGQRCSPKGTWEQPLAQLWANTHCLLPVPQGNDVLEDEDASPTQEDGKRPWVVVVPSLSAHCHREWGIPLCSPQLPHCHQGEPWGTPWALEPGKHLSQRGHPRRG